MGNNFIISGIAFNSLIAPASECFLSKLLAYRREFLHVGVLFASVKGALVSSADVILTKIAVTAACIAGDTTNMGGMTHTLASLEEDEAILASSQLPCKS